MKCLFKIKSLITASLLLFATQLAFAGELTAVGLWKTIDDTTGKPRSLIRISEHHDEFRAVVEKGLKETDTGDGVCDKCTDERKGQKIIGMTIAKGLKSQGHLYAGGNILDPDNGKVYQCKMTLSDDGQTLEVRGFIGISLLGRSQTWLRVE